MLINLLPYAKTKQSLVMNQWIRVVLGWNFTSQSNILIQNSKKLLLSDSPRPRFSDSEVIYLCICSMYAFEVKILRFLHV